MCALLGRIPTPAEYLAQVGVVNQKAADIYRYMNFDQIAAFAGRRRRRSNGEGGKPHRSEPQAEPPADLRAPNSN